MRLIYFDMEATGLFEDHRLVEIALVETINLVPTGNDFHHYINPERSVPARATNIHGLTDAFLADKPRFNDIAQEMLHYIGNDTLIFTCRTASDSRIADIDMANNELASCGHAPIPRHQWHNIRPFGEDLFGVENATMDNMLDFYKIDRSERMVKGHGALRDARLLCALHPELAAHHKLWTPPFSHKPRTFTP